MGGFLVLLQFGLLLLLALLAAGRVLGAAAPAAALLPAGASVVLALWTLRHNRLGNFNIRPTPRHGGTLVLTGPYHWIRHPMYTSVLLGAGALAWAADPAAGWLTWLALAVVLYFKARLEERWMCQIHPAYTAYMQVGKRFLPWLL
jgi:protein-S-isoprenylcysteine O-methyltransferase Ste14